MLFFLVAGTCAFAQPFQKPELFQSRPSFYHDTPAGTLAFVPDSRRPADVADMTIFKAFSDNGFYQLPAKSSYGFAVNIWDPSKKTPTFLAVTILQVLPPDATNANFELYRNANWESVETAIPLGLMPGRQLDHVTYGDVLDWSNSFGSITEFDTEIFKKEGRKIPWHGKPSGGDTSSWDVRKQLFGILSKAQTSLALSSWFEDIKADRPVRISSRLLGFTPSDNWVPRVPMDFYFRDSGATHVVINIFCPDYSDFNRTAFLRIGGRK